MRHLATTGRLLTVLAFLAAPGLALAQPTSSGVVDTGVVQFEFFDNGELGAYADAAGVSTGVGFVHVDFPTETGLYEGTFLLGKSFSQVSGDAYELSGGIPVEWVPLSLVETITPPDGFDQAFETEYDDSAAAGDGPLGVTVTAQAWGQDGASFVINGFVIENTSGGDLTALYPGIFADFDVSGVNFAMNLCAFDEATQLLLCWDPTGTNPVYYGIAALDTDDDDVTVRGVSYDALPGDAILYGGLTVIQTPPTTGADRRTVLGVGPYDITAGASQAVYFAWVAGNSEAEIIDNAAAAQKALDAALGGGVAIEPLPDGTPGTHAISAPAPNPANGRTAFTLEVARTQPVHVAVYDALGREVAVLHDAALSAGSEHRFTVDSADLPAGVYVIRATGEEFNATRTISLVR